MTTQTQILVYFLLKGYSLSSIKFLIKQYQNETANGTSRLFQSNHNAFGMSCPMIRPTTAIGCENLSDGNTNAVFRSVWSSLKDRYLWDKYFNINGKSINYSVDVSKRYHPSPDYEPNIQAISDEVYKSSFSILFSLIPITIYLIYLTLKN